MREYMILLALSLMFMLVVYSNYVETRRISNLEVEIEAVKASIEGLRADHEIDMSDGRDAYERLYLKVIAIDLTFRDIYDKLYSVEDNDVSIGFER